MQLYKDYFTIDEKYKPVMTREEFVKEPKKWLGFYPHPSFIAFLRAVLDQMERCKTSVWLTGAYGTGKTYAALVLQKLFNDTDENIDEWFAKRQEQFTAETIKQSLKKLRKEGVLAVFETGSDAVGAKDQFLVRIERAIIRTLLDQHLVIPPKGELEKVIERIQEEGDNFFATRDTIQDRLAYLNRSYKKFADLKKGLNNEDLHNGLLSDSLTVLRERFIFLDLTSESLLKWVSEVLKRNNLSKLIFIWDEFSAYVDKNRSELKTLEELAEAAQQGEFYFIPVTHMKIDAYLAAGAESAKKARDRFEFKSLDMPNDTAFRLAADAFQILPSKKKEWEQDQALLWSGVKDVVDIHFREEKDILPESFKNILPIHPMAAFVLKHLATFVGSNQRSLFDYLKNDAKGSEFREFIDTGGPDVRDKQYLTVDHLWKYFVERDDLGQEQKVLELKSEYHRQATNLQPEEQRVFKAILLFSLLGWLQKNSHPLLQPTVENIVQSFIGDGAMQGVTTVIKELEAKGCFHVVNGRCEMFRSNINEVELEKKKEELRSEFNRLVLNPKTKDAVERKIKEFNIGCDRFEVRVCSIDSITTNIPHRDRFAPDSGNQILIQFILAKDEADKLKIPEKIQSLAKHFHDHRMIFFTMPVTFCEKNLSHWEDYITYWAQSELALDKTAKQRYTDVTDNWDEEWKRLLLETSQKITGYKPHKSKSEPQQLQWGTLKEYLLNFVDLTLPECVDKYSGFGPSVFAAPSGLQRWAKAGISFQSDKDATGQAINAFKRANISGEEKWFENNPQHPLTKIRNLCLDKLKNTVSKNTTCSIREIYSELQRVPYGMRCNPYSAFVLGFVLKEFLAQKPQLQWTDGRITRTLDQVSLGEIIDEVVKDDGSDMIRNEKLICRLSKEEKAFIEQSRLMFGISTTTDDSVEAVLETSHRRLQSISNRVPLWCLPDYIDSQHDPQAESCKEIIDHFCAASIFSKSKMEDRNNHIQQIGRILLKTDGLAKVLSKYIKGEKFSEAFRLYVDTKEPALKKVAEAIGDGSMQYLDAIKDKAVETASWLWKEDDYGSIIACVLREYNVVRMMKSLWDKDGFITYRDAIAHLRKAVFDCNKIPLSFITRRYPAMETLTKCLRQEEETDISEALLHIIQNDTTTIKNIFFHPVNDIQINLLAENLSDVSMETLKEIYQQLPKGADKDESDYIELVRNVVNEHLAKSLATQIKNLWYDKTKTQSPNHWAEKHRMPLTFLFGKEETARDFQMAIDSPESFTPVKLQPLLDSLQHWTLPKIDEKQKILETAKRRIEKLSVAEAKDLLKLLLEKHPDAVLTLMK